MLVKNLEGMTVIIFHGQKEGFSRSFPLEYFALEPKVALALGKELINHAKELLNETNT